MFLSSRMNTYWSKLKQLLEQVIRPSNVQGQSNMGKTISSASSYAAVRMPMIKFIGARLPRPNFSRVDSGSIPAVSTSPAAKPSSASSVRGTHATVVSEENLPRYFRRPPISQEECDAINAGGAYGM